MHEKLIAILPTAVILSAAFGLIYALMVHRAKEMRSLASRWGFQYIGPGRSRWRSPSTLEKGVLPEAFPTTCRPVLPFRQVWNVIEGSRNGVSILIFDSVIGIRRGSGRYCTFIAISSESNPFATVTAPEKLVHSHGWIGLYRLRFIQIPWTMGIQQIEQHLARL